MNDLEKLKRLIHYVAWKAGKRDWFGATKLYKVLWFADARQFVLTKKPITDAVYIREKYGPVPKDAMIARRELERERAIKVSKEGTLTRIVALSEPDVSIFSADEIKSVDYWIEHIDKEHTAKSISDQSHDYAWDIAKMGEELPLVAVLANRIREPDERELERLRKRARALGLT
jgi:antitoxin SocA-like protein